MKVCPRCGTNNKDIAEKCCACNAVLATGKDATSKQIQPTAPKTLSYSEKLRLEEENRRKNLIISSTPSLDGYKITRYIDFISAEAALGMGAITAQFAGLSNFFGGFSGSLADNMSQVKKYVMGLIKEKAIVLKADAVVGVSLEYTMFGDSIVAVVVSGTAVCIEKQCENNES